MLKTPASMSFRFLLEGKEGKESDMAMRQWADRALRGEKEARRLWHSRYIRASEGKRSRDEHR